VVESRHVRVSYDGELNALETTRDITERKRADDQIQLLMRDAHHIYYRPAHCPVADAPCAIKMTPLWRAPPSVSQH
jgi:hypothetical protein